MRLSCSTNDLTGLSLSGCESLLNMICHDNSFPTLDVAGSPDLKKLVQNQVRIGTQTYDYFNDGEDSYLAIDKGVTVMSGSTVLSSPGSPLNPDEVSCGNGVYRLNHAKKKAVFIRPVSITQTVLSIQPSVNVGTDSYEVTQVGQDACRGMKSLKKVSIGKNVSIIQSAAFRDCTSLTTITGGKGLITIKADALRNCSALKKLVLYTRVKNIGARALYNCKRLKSLEVRTKRLTSRTVGAHAFRKLYSKAVVKCPAGKKSAYRKLFRSRGAKDTVKFTY